MKEKQQLHINNVGKIILDDQFTKIENQDHCIIVIYSRYDGSDFYDDKLKLTVPGLQALYKEIGDILREFEKLKHPL